MAIKVKICGINSPGAADAALRAGADFAGLVFFDKSPRALTRDAGAALADRLRGRAKLAALVVDADDMLLADIVDAVKPDFLQLHGRETPERAAAIAARFRIPLIKALPLASADDLSRAGDYSDSAAMFLFDTPPAPGADRPGGHGAAFDWRLLKDKSLARPWFLAGGLHPGNVARAIDVSGAAMVDVSSGVESAPGVKSESLIAAFVAAARAPVRA